jgi:hypothetical protein
MLGVQSDPSFDSLAPPPTDLQLQSLTSSSATSPINHNRINTDNTQTVTRMGEELCSSLAQLNIRDGSEETKFTKRRDCAEKDEGLRESSVDRGEQNLTEFEEKRKIEIIDSKRKRDNTKVIEKEGHSERRSDQYLVVSSDDLKGKRTSDKLAGISEEKERETESDDKVLEWRISDVFSGLNNDSLKNH